jgi:ankyrin repeat protein
MTTRDRLRAWFVILTAALTVTAIAHAAVAQSTTTGNAATRKPGTVIDSALAAVRQRQYTEATQALTAAANAGTADAQYLLGMIYLNGLGQLPDVTQAASWLEKAAVQGQREAAFVLAAILGHGAQADPAAARKWLERSAALGYERARAALADPRPLMAAAREVPKDATLRRELALYAVISGDTTLLGTLGNETATVRDDFGCSALCTAVAHHSTAAAGWLLQHGVDPQLVDNFGVTPLMQAASLESPELLSMLLARQAPGVEAADQEHRTALFYAARANRPQSVQLLLRAGAAVSAADSRGYGPLDVAVLAEARDAAAALREAGARQQATVSGRGATVSGIDAARPGALYHDWPVAALAAARDDVQQLRAQLAAPGTLKQRSPQGDTLLHIAYHAGAGNALRVLLEAGADAGTPDRRNRSVLMLAAADNNAPALQQLIANRNGQQALDAALLTAVAAGAADTTRLLLTAGANATAADDSGSSALAMAARLGQAEQLKLLLAHGANVNAADHGGRSALWLAARNGDGGSVAALLAAQAKVDAADQDRNTPLMAAIVSGRAAVVTQLLAAGAQTELSNQTGDTALMLAAANGRGEIVQALLARSHKVNAQNRHGDTAVILASRNGHVEVCRTLLKDGASLKLRNGNRLNAADAARDRGFAALADELSKAG